MKSSYLKKEIGSSAARTRYTAAASVEERKRSRQVWIGRNGRVAVSQPVGCVGPDRMCGTVAKS